MFNHEPENYSCPFCGVANGIYDPYTLESDVVYRDANTTAFIASRWWNAAKAGVIVVPNQHHENIYDISDVAIASTQQTAKKIAIAIRSTYGCDGTSTRQHNEPDGDQDVWHYHVHVFPRYKDDELYKNHGDRYDSTQEERRPYADKIRSFLEP